MTIWHGFCKKYSSYLNSYSVIEKSEAVTETEVPDIFMLASVPVWYVIALVTISIA